MGQCYHFLPKRVLISAPFSSGLEIPVTLSPKNQKTLLSRLTHMQKWVDFTYTLQLYLAILEN